MTARRRALGERGEQRAAAHYEDRGYRVVARNWRVPGGEIDLVVEKASVVVFVEVKTRSSARYGSGLDAVTAPKQLRLRRLAAEFLARRKVRGVEVRFDVVAVTGSELDVVEGAF